MNYKTIDKDHYLVKENFNFGINIDFIFKHLLQLLDSIANYLFKSSPYIYKDSLNNKIYKTNVDLNLIRNQRTFL